MSYYKITYEQVKEILAYHPQTGLLYWKPRLNNPQFNSQRAGKQAFTCKINGKHKGGHILGKRVYAHRVAWLIMTGDWPDSGKEIDHINGDPADNRWDNLRLVSSSLNSRNMPLQSNNNSGYPGVRKCDGSKNGYSRIKVNGRVTYLGQYPLKEEAIKARKDAEIKYGFHKNHGRNVRKDNA